MQAQHRINSIIETPSAEQKIPPWERVDETRVDLFLVHRMMRAMESGASWHRKDLTLEDAIERREISVVSEPQGPGMHGK